MKNRYCLAIFLLVAASLPFQDSSAQERDWYSAELCDTYTTPNKGELTKDIVSNLSYYVTPFGISDTYDANATPTLIKFTAGKTRVQDGKIKIITFGQLIDKENAAAALISQFDGANHDMMKLCAILPEANLYRFTCAWLVNGYGVAYESVKIVNKRILIDVLYPGPFEPMCCPTTPGTFEFKIQDNILVQTKKIDFSESGMSEKNLTGK